MAGLRGLTTPIKIVSAVIFVLFGLTTFFAGHSFNSLISGNEDAQAAGLLLLYNKGEDGCLLRTDTGKVTRCRPEESTNKKGGFWQ